MSVEKINNSAPHNVVTFHSPSLARHPNSVTNRQFVRALFGDDADRAWVASVSDGNKSDWFGGRAGDLDVDTADFTSGDTYFAVGVLKDHAPARATSHWSHTHVIVVDDVGEKVTDGAVRAAFGEPTYVLQTSRGSRQFGYSLHEPLRDAALQARIMRAITIGLFKGVDPGHGDNVRYVRLPRGMNSKPKRVAENGGRAQRVMLLEWHPERRFDVMDFDMALRDLPGLNGESAWAEAEGAGVTHRAMPEGLPRTLEEARAQYLPRDYIFAAFDKLDRVVGMQGSQGYIEVRCPFAGSHTNDDDRTGWNPALFLSGHSAFQCFHSDDGADRSNRGIEAALRAELDERDGPGSFDALRKAALAVTFPPLPDTGSDLDTPPKPRTKWRSLGSDAPLRALPARRVVSSLLIRGATSQLGSPPNAGKSQLVVNLVHSLAAERHDLFGEEKPFQRTGGAFVITNEDGADELERRRTAFMTKTGLQPADLKHPVFVNERPGFKVVHRHDKSSPVEITPEMGGLADDIRAARAGGHDIAAVVVDTQAASFSGIEENSNDAMAAAWAAIGAWAEELDVAVLILHHTTKDAARTRSVDMNAMRGASAAVGSARCVAQLVPLSPEEEAKLPEADRGSYIRLTIVKASYAKFAGSRWFRKIGVDLPTVDDAGEVGPVESTAACIFDPKGPKLRLDDSDENLLINGLLAVCAADADGKSLSANMRGPVAGRADAVIGEALGAGRDDGRAILRALERRGWIEQGEEPVAGRRDGRTRAVWRATAEGSRVAEERAKHVFDDVAGAGDEPASELPVLERLPGSGGLAVSAEIDCP